MKVCAWLYLVFLVGSGLGFSIVFVLRFGGKMRGLCDGFLKFFFVDRFFVWIRGI